MEGLPATPAQLEAAIDATWGPGLPTARKLEIFDQFWTTIDQRFATFQGIDRFVISLIKKRADGTFETTAVAEYIKGQKGELSGDKTLTLVPTGDSELLGYLNGKTLEVGFSGSGTPPTVAWIAQVTLDFHVIAQKNIL